MALSEHEQQVLDQIEQALYAEDPKFVAAVQSVRRPPSPGHRWVLLSVLGVLVGLLIVMVGLVLKLIPLGVVGFVLMVTACAYATASIRRRVVGPPSPGVGPVRASKSRRGGGIRARMEQRLRRRFDQS
ncbi:MAG: DUF3040 domain-containing protein [Actinomycetia bacterium]|nr:DUF3040 domain-containing protein [Actinomycetes bacterium]